MPIKTLQEISDFADRRAVRLSEKPKKIKPTSSEQSEPGQLSESDKESDGESAYDSGSIALSDWPPSSPAGVNDTRQLPPDSSPELSTKTVNFSHKKPQERFLSLSPPPRNSASVSKKREPVNTSPSYSLPSPSRRPTRSANSPKLHPKPTPLFGNDSGSSNLAHNGQVTETDYSQGTDGDQTGKESGIPESRRPGEAMKDHDDSTGVGTIKKQVDLVNSKNTDPSQPSLDSHEISTTKMESSGHGPDSQISNSNAEMGKRPSHVDNTSIESSPSTASQREEPGLQVKRTPYCNGPVADIDSQILESYKSPSKSRSLSSANDIRITRDTHSLSTQPDIVNASCIDSQRTILSDDLAICSDVEAVRNHQLQKQHVPQGELAIYSHGEESGHYIPDEDLIAWQLQREIASQSQSGASRSTYVEETRLIVDETVFQRTTDLRAALIVPSGTQATSKDEDGKGMKHKLLENELLSPNITKRRRNFRDVGEPDRKFKDISAIERALGILSNSASASPSNQEHTTQLSAEDPPKLFDQGENETAAGQDGESPAAQYKPEKPSTISSFTPSNAQVKQAREGEQGLRDKPRNSTDDPVDESMIDVDAQGSKGEKSTTEVDSVASESVQPSRNITIFDRLKLSYPEYSGNMQHFTAVCSKLQKRVDAGRGLHQALWDDFILRHKIEYANYLQDCANKAEDPMPYDKFYEDEIDGARFIKQVVTRKTLHEVLALPPSNEEKGMDRGRNSYLAARSRVVKSRHSSRNLQLGSRYASPQIIDLSEKTPEISSRRSLPWLSPNTPRSTPRPKPVTPSTPRPSFLSRIRSNQPSTSRHLSRKKPETEGNSPALLSTVNTPSINRGEASVLEAPPDRAFAPVVDADYRWMERDVVRTLDNASPRDGPRSRTERDTDRASSNAPLPDAPRIRMGRDISQASSNAPPPDAPWHRITRDVSQTSSDTPLLGADYRRIKRDSDRASRESHLRTIDYRTSARYPDQTPETSLLNTAHLGVKRDPDQASNEIPRSDADARRSKRDLDRATKDSPRRTSNCRKVKSDTNHPADTSALPKSPSPPHRSSKHTDQNPSATTTFSKPIETETADNDDDSNKPFIKFAKEYLAIEAGHGNSFGDPKRSYDGKERPKLRKLDVASWHL